MEVIQNNVAQNLMAMFPMRPAELILQCVTHPRNCYEPVDEGVLLNRCIDDLLSREDAPDDGAKVNIDKEPLQNEEVDDFVVDDIPDGDPVVVDDPEDVFTVPNLQDLDVEPDTAKEQEILIDLTDDNPTCRKEVKAVVVTCTGTEISSTLKTASSEKDSSLDSISKDTLRCKADEAYGELLDVLGFPVQSCTAQQSKVKTQMEAATFSGYPVPSLGSHAPSSMLGTAARPYSHGPGNQVTDTVLNCNSTKNHVLGSLGFQCKVSSQEHGTYYQTATTCSTGMSSTARVSSGGTVSAHSRPAVFDEQVQSRFQSKSNSGPSMHTTFNVRKGTGQELGTHHGTTTTCTGVAGTSSMFKGSFSAQSRQLVINGHLGLKPAIEQKLQKIQIQEGKGGNCVVGSSTPRVLTVRQELDRKRAIPATLSRAPSDEIKSGTLVMPPTTASGATPVSDLSTPKNEIKEGNVRPKFVIHNTASKDSSNKSSSTITVGSTGIPLKIKNLSGIQIHSKAAPLCRAPSASSSNTALSFQPASTLQLGSSTNSISMPNLQINGTSSGPAFTTKQGEQIRPVILKSASILRTGMSQGFKIGTGKVNLPQNSLATNISLTPSNNAAPNLAGNMTLVSTNSSNAPQGLMKQSNTQHVGGSYRCAIPILPKCTGAGDVKHSSAFSVVNQRPIPSVPHTLNSLQVQIPKPIDKHGVNQLNPGSVNDGPRDRLLQQSLLREQMQLKELAKYKGLAPPPQPPFPLDPLPLHPPVQPRPLPVPVPFKDPAGGLDKVSVPRLDPAPRQAIPETTGPTGATTNDSDGMEAASVELENMVQLVMKMFPTADKGIVRGMLLEHRNVNATCNYLLENLDAASGGIPADNTVSVASKEKEKEIDYLNIDPHKRGFIQNYHQYFNQGLDLLSNDFVKISKTSLRLVMQHLTRGSYAKTKKILEDTIKANPNIQVLMRDDTRGSFFHVERDGRKFEIRLMKKARKPIHIFNTMHPELQKEVDFYKNYLISETEKSDFEVALKLNEDQYEQEGQLIECGCCYLEVTFENMIQCLEGHLFCQTCLQRYTKEAVFGQGKATLSCLEDGCDSVFPRSQLEKTLTKEILVKYDERVVEESINMADMDNLLRCPNCNYAAVLDKDHKVFSCPECHKETCRNCKEPWKDHYGLECDQVKKQSTMRLTYQERMTEAKVRTCYKCGTKFTKSEGCNKMTCRCGAKMCYICRQPIMDYSHFDNKAAPPRGQIFTQRPGEKCRLWTNSDEDDDRAVKEIEREMKAEEKALREKSAADLKRPSMAGSDEGGGSDAKRPRTG